MEQRTVMTNGIRMRIAQAGAGPLVLLLHGFPESWYSWRHQIPALAAAGFRVVAPDQRGYGATEAPTAVESYDILHLVDDAVGLLDELGEEQAVVVGHDWGAPVAWHCALLHPQRFRAVAALSVPYVGRSPLPPLDMFRAMAGENFFYILYFQQPGVAEDELEADVRATMRRFLYAASGDVTEPLDFWRKPKTAKFLDGLPDPRALPPWLTEADLDYFTSEFRRAGFRGGLNWYRNVPQNWEWGAKVAGKRVFQPALMVTAGKDGVLTPDMADGMERWVPNLTRGHVEQCGHWAQQEEPEKLNRFLIDWLQSL